MTLVDERVSVVLAYIELIYVFKNVSLTEILVSIINDTTGRNTLLFEMTFGQGRA